MTTSAQPPAGNVEKPSRIEAHSIDVIPEDERHGRASSLGVFWFNSSLNVTSMSTGVVIVSLGGTLFWNLIAIVLGSLVGTTFMALHGTQGPQLGLPQMIQSRAQFGYAGAAITVFVAVYLNYLTYNTTDALLTSDMASTLSNVPAGVGYVVAAAVAAIIALFGYDMIHKVIRLMVIPTTSLIVLLTVGVFRLDGISTLLSPGEFSLPIFMTAFVITAGFQLGWAPYVSDYSRYLPASTSSRSMFWWTYAPCAASAVWAFSLGALALAATGAQSPVAAFKAAGDAVFPGAGTIILIGLLIGLLAAMSVNQYGGSLTLLSIVDSIRPIRATRSARMIAILVMAVMVWGIAQLVGAARFNEFYSNGLIYLAYLFTPWTAINLVDYFIVRRGHYVLADLFKRSGGIYGRWGWRGNSVYAMSIAAMVPFMVTAQFVGSAAAWLGNVDYSMFVGLIVGSGLYLLVCMIGHLPTAAPDDVEALGGAVTTSEQPLTVTD